MDRLAEAEADLLILAREGLAGVPGLRIYQMWTDAHPRTGIVPFTIEGIGYAELATVLSAEYAIATRHGCACAHPLVTHLLDLSDQEATRIAEARRYGFPVSIPGIVRASLGLGTTADDVLMLVTALDIITSRGTAWAYTTSPDGTHCVPDNDPRQWPELPFRLG
jgi:selenocysteine lyase/cysteine desulfurase